jgi:hypothetical protein
MKLTRQFHIADMVFYCNLHGQCNIAPANAIMVRCRFVPGRLAPAIENDSQSNKIT